MAPSVEQQSPVRVLIVEDNDAQRNILTDLIRDEGFEPVACRNATEALARAGDGLFRVAILDQRLPEMSGTELLERLRTMQRGIRVIIHTAYGSFESAKDAVNLGAFAYVEKLGDPEVLIRQVHQASQVWMAEALQRSEESFRLMFAHNPVPMWVYDRETHAFLDVNAAALEKYGYDRDAFLSMNIEDIHPAEDIPRFREYLGTVSETVHYMTQWRHRKKDGTLLDVAVTSHNFPYRERPGRLVLADDVTERKRLEKEILEISNREQRRVGQDLHDGLGQLLTGIGFRLAELEGDLQKAGLPVASEAAEIGQMVERAIAQTRALAHGLDPVNVEQQGLARALDALTRSIENIYGIPCVFDCPAPLPVHDPEVAIHVYRIAQEAITNALKHAAASRIDVTMTQHQGRVTLRVSDDGVGLPETNPPHAGMGLRIMDYRARMIGGTFDVAAGPDAGAVVTCCFPYMFLQEPAD